MLPASVVPEREALTPDGLRLALDSVRTKWQRQGATFQGDVQATETGAAQGFMLDDQRYELQVAHDKTLTVLDLEGGQRRPVLVPKGLTFPRGFRRPTGYDR